MYLPHFQTLQSWLSCCRTALEAFLCSYSFVFKIKVMKALYSVLAIW